MVLLKIPVKLLMRSLWQCAAIVYMHGCDWALIISGCLVRLTNFVSFKPVISTQHSSSEQISVIGLHASSSLLCLVDA